MQTVQVSYQELAARYGELIATNIVAMLDAGTSPALIRELDYLTGAVHYEYALPQPSGITNIWRVSLTPEGEIDPASITWSGPGPAPGPPPTPTELMSQRREGVTQFPSVTVTGLPAGYQRIDSAYFERTDDPQTGTVQFTLVGQTTTGQQVRYTPTGVTTTGTAQQEVPAAQTGPGGTQQPVAGSERGTIQVSLTDLDRRIIERAGGDQFYTWDEWNWFYEQVTGRPGPAPEDRGLRRNADGSVTINGSTRFNYATWKAYAFGTGVTTATGQQVQQGFLAQLLDLLRKLVRILVGGGRGAF